MPSNYSLQTAIFTVKTLVSQRTEHHGITVSHHVVAVHNCTAQRRLVVGFCGLL